MKKNMVVQGRIVTEKDTQFIRHLIQEHPLWHRTRLSRELCVRWNWRNAKGRVKDMACRTFLLKLERAGYLKLPLPRTSANNANRHRTQHAVLHDTTPLEVKLKAVTPIRVVPLFQQPQFVPLFKTCLSLYHYLGYRGYVGQNMKYLVFDKTEKPLSCLLFGSAAWKIAPRDKFIGWDAKTRKQNLPFLTNNMRFLVLPWVRIPHLASHLLSRITRRIRSDWEEKYGHTLHLLETFVDTERFRGVCYQAANWERVGATKGRSRNDRYNTLRVPIKEIYLYPLHKRFREALRQ